MDNIHHPNPFFDVIVDATFTSPSGQDITVPAFYDGTDEKGSPIWRVRFNPDEVGTWAYRTVSRPTDPALDQTGSFEVTPHETRGFLKATPGEAWGFQFESGEPAFLLGDTTYNLFGMAHCDGDVEGFLRRRADQGFNLFRVRLQVSPFHGPQGYSAWQTRRTWPWGGSEQAPQFDRFNLDYFRTVDRVMRLAEELELGFEMIMEAWGFEFPFNNRTVFNTEWEQLWMRYLIARYDAFNAVYFWDPMNEYEYYPNGDWRYNPIADRWAIRTARWIKDTAQHGHVVAIHNGPRMPPFAQRFAIDPEAIDAIMFQEWGTRDQEKGWLAAGIETQIQQSLKGWSGAAIFAEYGYERNPDLPLNIPSHEFCDEEHTRRGAWRGAFCALNVIHGFENAWGPFMVLDEDQPGLTYLRHLYSFFTQIVPFDELQPASTLILPGEYDLGEQPLALASGTRDIITVYLPVGGAVVLDMPASSVADAIEAADAIEVYQARWYDPRTGECCLAAASTVLNVKDEKLNFIAPEGQDAQGHPWDWVLILQKSQGD
jgi:hypothetical protein